jgi:hypothetical protein
MESPVAHFPGSRYEKDRRGQKLSAPESVLKSGIERFSSCPTTSCVALMEVDSRSPSEASVEAFSPVG